MVKIGSVATKLPKGWFKSNLVVIPLLIYVFPVGLYLMWRYKTWNLRAKALITALVIAFLLVGSQGGKKNNLGNGQPIQKAETQELTPTIQKENALLVTPELTTTPVAADVVVSTTPISKTVLVMRVIDGDTIEIEGGRKVRYIGIDTPETVHPDKGVECYGIEASNKNKELVQGKKIRLEKDVSETDKYGRLLRYVWTGDTFVNDYLVKQGYAHSSTYPPDIKFQEQLRQSQREAMTNNRGLWSGCAVPSLSKPSQNVSEQNSGCSIKGNVSTSGEKIYHLSGCQSYQKTIIDETKGERWFCSEDEAVKSGWRKAKNC